ncbi:hypothetical protein L1D44_13665 [Shewanella sp. Isolate13]|uniref:hypothetical protein n=1 Tax=Shewanella sp. Isolate13 TaxID=2908531 RepID=UPI001EFC663C|nr:hypothetical protein [Shewanella sp. Isolate13]MCG9730877.1 hypothetical protein [Shewanella sp. Isolate13]
MEHEGHEERLQFAVSSNVATSVGRYKAILGRSAVSNNIPVKQPVRHPCLSFEEYLYEIPHPETEAHSRSDI